ncbi:pilus assembly protein [Novosphingobium sp. YJ-S2-02]|uniref:Pilus assembly protein n=1 Tax=Novosphingobium aureum TaxID=2792964 RepID=A0A931ML14_9SPHN|nr:TadE/TadG family type IV pilus assembly protein [Novosphingobium aureum]MBH0112571.1 pilus assembly protein [Novosphingobium aureum]
MTRSVPIHLRLLRDTTAAAAAEMALMVPLLVLILFSAFEAGHFFWTEHKVVEAVRNGARYASRLPMSDVCPTSGTTTSNIALYTRTGQLTDSSASPVVPGWSNNNQVTVTIACDSYLDTGIYTSLAGVGTGKGATVTVAAASLTYPSLFETLGLFESSLNLNASASTAVIGL